jgi:hypothetical protein
MDPHVAMLEASAPNDQDTGAPMSQVLGSVATELQALAILSDRLQSLISKALVADSATNAEHLQEFQAIDLLVQRLSGVATFAHALSQAAPQTWRIDAAAAAASITLSDLSRRLSGHSDRRASQPSHDDDSNFEMFA